MSRNDPANWQARLAGRAIPTDINDPDYGFYRVPSRDKATWRAVAFWYDDDGTLRCRLDDRDIDEHRARELWQYAVKRPISHETYVAVTGGGQWPDINEAVAGHNRAPVDDDASAIADRIDDLAREAERLINAGAAPDKDTADQASDLANTFGELENKVARLHKDEKDPHLEAGRAVDRKWFPLRDRAADLKRRLKALVVTPFLAKEQEKQQAAQVAAVAAGAAPETVAPVRAVAGSSKRSSGLRTYYRAEIEDKTALIESLKDHPELIACIQKIADAAAQKKIALPGCKVIADKRAA